VFGVVKGEYNGKLNEAKQKVLIL